ncbi:G-protein coupled receptor 161-like [Dendronephthya gigantea]|uniref:G-protein coupled receptor 161-like n=1 Tax=Dendronephthya gigantea TaxID=151771 RepID=UPI0010695E05|nr:G-protein coupled receptor 161-like [Dendronephthya gigantea]XP_028409891.1 G-protein coupled receptor 161-like [Dendronephthya gigantea]
MRGLKSIGNGTSLEFTPSPGVYVLVVVVILTAVASVIGNVLVQIAFWRTRSLKVSSPAILVMVLALADFGMSVLVMPFVVSTALHGKWSQSHELCVASGFLNTLLTAIQFGVLFSISINRFMAISYPHRYLLKWKTSTTYAMVFLVVVHSLLWSIMPFLGWGGYEYIQGTLFCNINWSHHKAHSISLLAFCYIIPALIATILYITVYIKIRRIGQSPIAQLRMSSQLDLRARIERENDSLSVDGHSKISVNDLSSSPCKRDNINGSRYSINTINHKFRRHRTRESRVTTSLLMVAAAFAIFWLPRGLVNFSAVVSGRDSVPTAVEYLTSVFIFMSSFVNPIIYALFHYEYNKAFRKILRCNFIVSRG